MRKLLPLLLVLLLVPSCARRGASRPAAGSPTLTLVSCRLAAGRELVDVKLRVSSAEAFDPEPENTFLLDEASGERFFLVQLRRIGPVGAGGDPGKHAVRSLTFRNREGMLRPGARLTLVIGTTVLRPMVLEE